MYNVAHLTRETQDMCATLGIDFNFRQCKKIALKAVRVMERIKSETTDDYSVLTYKDSTGEEAVRNVIRALLANF